MKIGKYIFRPILFLLFLMMGQVSYAQFEKCTRAYDLYNTRIPSNIDRAALVIDSAVSNPSLKTEFGCWTTRAAIYYEIYKRADKFKLNSRLRDTVISSIHMSNRLKPDSVNKEFNQKLLKNIAAGYMSIAKKLIEDSTNYDRSLIAYSRFKTLYKEFDPAMNFHSNDIQFYLAVSTAFNDKYIKDSSDKALDVEKLAYLKVIEMEPHNSFANMGLGLMYYNMAVNLSKKLDFGADLDQLEVLQDNMVKLAKQGEQYILVVYNEDKKNSKAVLALYYIYRMLMDTPKHEEFKKKAIELGALVNDEKPNQGK